MDLFLGNGGAIRLFADGNFFAVGRGQVQQGGVGEMVVQDDGGFLKDTPGFDRNQFGVAGAGTDEE